MALTQEEILKERKRLGIPEQGLVNAPTQSSPESDASARVQRRRKLVAEQKLIEKASQPKENIISRSAKKIGNFLISNEKKFGQTLGDTAAAISGVGKEAQESQTGLDEMSQKLVDKIQEVETEGGDSSRLREQLQRNQGQDFDIASVIPSTQKSAKQIVGEGVGVATDIASAGVYGNAAKGAKTGQLLTKAERAANIAAKPAAKTATEAFVKGAIDQAPSGASIGAGYGASNAMQEDKDLGEIVKDTAISGATGGLLSGILGGMAERKQFLAPQKAEALQQKAVEQYKRALGATKEKYKEMSDKVIPELLAEGKWGTRKKLLNDALSNVSLSKEQYAELGELQGVAEMDGILSMIDKEMAKLKTPAGTILSTEGGKYKALEGLKEDVESYLISGQIFDAGGPVAIQQQLRGLADKYGKTLYETRKSLKTISDNATLSEVQKVDSAIRELLAKNNPTYADINKVYSLNNKVVDILNETAKRQSGGSVSTKRLVETITGSLGLMGSIAAGSKGLGAVALSLFTTGATVGAIEFLNSTWWNSLRAVQKSRAAEKILQMAPEKRNQALIMLGRQGLKYAQEIDLFGDSENQDNENND